MGMFDEIKYEYILPLEITDEVRDLGIVPEDILFQTKDLDSTLSLYTINREGRLIYKNVKYKWVDDDNAFLKGYMEEESHVLEDMNYHGDLEFYCYETIEKDGNYFSVSLDYNARFTNGKLEEVKLIKSEASNDNERQNSIKEMYKQLEEQKKIWYNKYFFHTKLYKKIVRRPIWAIAKTIYNLASSLNTFVIRHF